MINDKYYILCNTGADATACAQNGQNMESGQDIKKQHFIRIWLYYERDTLSWATCRQQPRGIYASVAPVERDGNWESFAAFSGCKHCLLELERWSKKAPQRVDQAEARRVLSAMIQAVEAESGWKTAAGEAARVVDTILADMASGRY